ncbi:MAG: hypothetical protein VYA80_05275, partial [Pseudomonadota bacterium]|nr:hypothetical protein [Pseudomonadota bacterium]
GMPSKGIKRSIARITAMETIFVQWSIYLLFLFFGGWFGNPFYLLMLIWSIYLTWKLFHRKRSPDSFRYAIPVAVIIWSLVEVGAFFGIYPEAWQAPFEYPITNSLMLVAFICSLWALMKRPAENALHVGD